MKKIYFFAAFFLLSFSLFSQQWSNLGTGLDQAGTVMTFYHGEMYVGGVFSNAGSAPASKIAKWDGANWSPLGLGLGGTVYAMTVYNDELYVAGSFTTADGHSAKRIARWNGTTWDTVGHGINGLAVYALEVYNGKLYAAGKFGLAGYVQVNNIAVWNDTAWSAVGNGITSSWGSTYVYSLKENNGELYAGGSFDIAGTDSTSFSIAKWNGNSWSHVGEGFNGEVECLASFNNQIYAAGYFWITSGYHVMNNISRWDGTNWNALGNGSGTNDYITSLCAYGNTLYLAGDFTTAGTIPARHIATWDGTNYGTLGAGVDTSSYAVAADEGIIYLSGNFTTAAGSPGNHIAKWSAAGVGINEFSSNENMLLFPNPNNGIFSVSKNTLPENSILEIYNVLGEKINSVELVNDVTEINLSNESKGIYFYEIISEEKVIASGKIMRQ